MSIQMTIPSAFQQTFYLFLSLRAREISLTQPPSLLPALKHEPRQIIQLYKYLSVTYFSKFFPSFKASNLSATTTLFAP